MQNKGTATGLKWKEESGREHRVLLWWLLANTLRAAKSAPCALFPGNQDNQDFGRCFFCQLVVEHRNQGMVTALRLPKLQECLENTLRDRLGLLRCLDRARSDPRKDSNKPGGLVVTRFFIVGHQWTWSGNSLFCWWVLYGIGNLKLQVRLKNRSARDYLGWCLKSWLCNSHREENLMAGNTFLLSAVVSSGFQGISEKLETKSNPLRCIRATFASLFTWSRRLQSSFTNTLNMYF